MYIIVILVLVAFKYASLTATIVKVGVKTRYRPVADSNRGWNRGNLVWQWILVFRFQVYQGHERSTSAASPNWVRSEGRRCQQRREA